MTPGEVFSTRDGESFIYFGRSFLAPWNHKYVIIDAKGTPYPGSATMKMIDTYLRRST